MKKWFKFVLLLVSINFFISVSPQNVLAAIELSGNFSFNRTSFGDSTMNWTRRWGVSIGYSFFGTSQIEFSMQDVLYRNKLGATEDTTFHDKIYSLDWVQAITPREWGFQPYFKLGVGQLNRNASGSYSNGAPPTVYDSITGIIGAGIKIYILKNMALRSEATTYLTGGDINTWRNNVGVTAGLSIEL